MSMKDAAALAKLSKKKEEESLPEEEAMVADLIDTEGEKWFTLSTGKKVKIKKILLGELGKITAKAKDDPFQNLKLMINVALVSPKLSNDQIDLMKPTIANEIGMAIADYSGLTPEALKSTRNLSETPAGPTPSG